MTIAFATTSDTVQEEAAIPRRHKALIEWSRDHTLGLAVAKHLTESSEKDVADRRSALQEFLAAWRDNLSDHFSQEEECLLPILRTKGDAKRLQKEHAAIRANAELAGAFADDEDIDATWLRGVGKLLRDHIRWEERELFPSTEQTASKVELQRIARQVTDARTGTRGKSQKRSPTKTKAQAKMSDTTRSANDVPATMVIPDLLRTYPHVRPVLDRYGLQGAGDRSITVPTITIGSRPPSVGGSGHP